MTNIIELTGVSVPPQGGKTKHLIVFLHGYGADANDLISLAPIFAGSAPDCAFASPNAPFPCEMGFGRQWFGLADRSQAAMTAGVSRALPALQAYIDEQQKAFAVEDAATALIGFSQGTMMALAAGLSRRGQLGAIVGYSGALVSKALPILSRPPVFLAHGNADEVVPFAAMAHAEAALQQHRVPVESMAISGLGHGIDPQGIEGGLKFLNKIWGMVAAENS